MKKLLLGLPRWAKRFLQLVADITLVCLSLWLAFVARVGFDSVGPYLDQHLWLFAVAPIIAVMVFIPFGMYRAVIRYFNIDALKTITNAISISALLLALAIYWFESLATPVPRSVVFNYWVFSLLTMGGLRWLMRVFLSNSYYLKFKPSKQSYTNLPRVIIYGAGSSGNQLVAALRLSGDILPIAFVDDDSSIYGRTIAGLRVYKPRQLEKVIRRTNATQVLLAIPSASRARRKEVLESLAPYPVHVRTIPGFMDLASGKIKVQDIQDVDIADLLGRDEVEPNRQLFERCIKKQNVMVTGAGGSIGSELCRQILASGALKLVLYEHSEFNLYAIQTELQQLIEDQALSIELIPILGSIRNFRRLKEVMACWQIDTVYHAAAYKHVPLVEMNVVEGIVNNVFGTLNTAQAAIATQVKNFVLISTDKAVRPTNVMGSTKRLAEMTLQALSQEREVVLFDREPKQSYINTTRFTMVRFGNVLGSSGSVIPLFTKQIKDGNCLTVTHPKITRYFMTIPEAAQLVIQAGSMGQGGDVLVLDMGEPVKILDLAQKMIMLTGLSVRNPENPDGDIEIKFTGLRLGEKLYEELLIGDNVTNTQHPKIMRANEDFIDWQTLTEHLGTLNQLARADNCLEIRQQLRKLVEGYQPQGGLVDLVFKNKQDTVNTER
ncbi:polysaccharide biosynthesis protein [Marinospirillum insulare]|uniref:Nucleotide sugar epimerase/dehydratase WbpM n=1 Tax=Marinospirillum insulare TaxID=217169 RepID=A0ABQ6A2Q9_9GAMM|nr:nucleoside-diphosphate sugar epimerase/dehydratase [Marinospirillum insulare]GLR64379.1 nucleotide sugar epimerase/dehydratase WbpM [Marinospirillum insulare]